MLYEILRQAVDWALAIGATADPGHHYAFWGAAIGAAGGVLGAYMQGKEAKKNRRLSAQHLRMQETARRDAMAALSQDAINATMRHFFPGLVGSSGMGTFGENVPMSESVGQSAVSSVPQWFRSGVPERVGAVQPRATGGPVQPGQQYLVGEGAGPETMVTPQGTQPVGQQGPEIITPSQPGTVLPNPAQPGTGQGTNPLPFQGQQGQPITQAQAAAGGVDQASTTQRLDSYISPNDALMGQMYGLLTQPGQFTTANYERAQEQASRDYNQALRGIEASAVGGGFDPSSGMAMSLKAGAAETMARRKGEAARDQALIESQLRREDIGMGSQLFMNMLNYITQLQSMRAQAAGGQGFAPAYVPQASNVGANYAQAFSMIGQALSNNKNNKTDNTTDEQGG